MKASAFSPGHITGFFLIKDKNEDISKKGSLGAGFCLSKGAVTTVNIEKSGKQKIDVFLNNKKSRAEVTQFVVKKIIGEKKIIQLLGLPCNFQYLRVLE